MATSHTAGNGRSRTGRCAVVPAVLALLFSGMAGGTYLALDHYGSPAGVGTCVASGLGTTHRYELDQTENAALISAIAVDRELPPRAASIALATAYQESKIRNITYGDRDSLGLFQQRPSQGWGTQDEILDPVYSTNAFYDGLVQIDYTSMTVNDAAQTVQRSGFPEAYADHETEGRIYASALTGQSPANLDCILQPATGNHSPETVAEHVGTAYPRSVESGRISTSLQAAADVAPAHEGAGPTALVVDVGGNTELGWSVAQWAVARAGADGIVQISYDGRIWDRHCDAREAPWVTDSTVGAQHVVIVVAGG